MRRLRSPHALRLTVLLLLAGCPTGKLKAPSSLSYTTGTAVYRTGMLITANRPTGTGGTADSYLVTPALPEGLSLEPTTGVISGTPTATSAEASYTVTAFNPAGSATATLSITVSESAPAQDLPNMGQRITPLAPPGATFEGLQPGLQPLPAGYEVGQAVTSVVSPDKRTLLVLTSGFNIVIGTNGSKNTNEYVFVYDISTNTPIKKQVLTVPNSYNGLVFDPVADAFYVSGGIGDGAGGADNVHVFVRDSGSGSWAEQTTLSLGHTAGLGLDVGNNGPTTINTQVFMKPTVAGLALSSDGQTLVAANYSNDSMTIFTGGLNHWTMARELDLRPGKLSATAAGTPGGEYPFWVVVTGTLPNAKAYISSIRDREVVVVKLQEVLDRPQIPPVPKDLTAAGAPIIVARLKVKGQPNKMALNAAQTRLYVVEDQSDRVTVIDTVRDTIVGTIALSAPASALPSSLADYTGGNPNSVTLSPDEKRLYVTEGNLNCVAVVALGDGDSGQVVGLIPTGWYPNSVSFSPDGAWAYVVNAKSPTGPNPDFCYSSVPTAKHPYTCFASNEYNPQRTKAGLQSLRVPTAEELVTLTAQVATNNRFASVESTRDAAVMAAVRNGVRHVILVIKENRTYDQILGDLGVGNGDSSLAEFGALISPNQQNLARTFVTLDNFLATSEVSNDGWPWTTSARAPDVVERNFPVSYAQRGLALESEGLNRNVNVALATLHERVAANPLTPNDLDLFPGQANVAAPDGPNNEVNTGYLWDSALRAKLTVRSYGFFVDTTLYSPGLSPDHTIPLSHDPASSKTVVANSTSAALAPYTDPYFRGFDNSFPDYYRYAEWARDFETRPLASLSLVRLMHDHTGNFSAAIDLVNTPERQVADNDYALGLLVQKVAHSEYAENTLIFVIEDDSQDGADHVDSHRTAAFVAGAWVKQGVVVSTQYNTIDFVRTIEEVLGLPPLNLNDALARPMADVFDTRPRAWTFTATPSAYLYDTRLPLPPRPHGLRVPKTTHDAKYWARVTRGMDFSAEDRFDFATYNRILWTGLMGNRPYPSRPTGRSEPSAGRRRAAPSSSR